MKVIYMGTPGFACKPLLALHESKHEVLAVVTGLEKRRGRGRDTCPTEVCEVAQELSLPVLMPKSLKSDKFFKALSAYRPDLIVVVAFRILPQKLFDLPTYGAINIHASLLPKYRGAAPINWALINGEKETGLTSFILNSKVDTGNVILQEKMSIGKDENFDALHNRLCEISGPFLLRTIDLLERPDFTPMKQDEHLATPAPKIKPDDAMIDFGLPARCVMDFVRGLSTRPGAYTFFRGRKIKILGCRVTTETDHALDPTRPGTVIADRKRLLIRCADGAVEVLCIVPEGKKQMDGISFINGFGPKSRELFGEIPLTGKEKN